MTPYYGIIVETDRGIQEWSGSLEDVFTDNLNKPDVDGYAQTEVVIKPVGDSALKCTVYNIKKEVSLEYFIKPEDRCSAG